MRKLEVKDHDTGVIDPVCAVEHFKRLISQWTQLQVYINAQGNLIRQLKSYVRRTIPEDGRAVIFDALEKGKILDAPEDIKGFTRGPVVQIAGMPEGVQFALSPMLRAYKLVMTERKEAEKQLIESAQRYFPQMAPFVDRVQGFGWQSLAGLLAEQVSRTKEGIIKEYDPTRWKLPQLNRRFGLGLDSEGRAEKKASGKKLGYSPRRRALMWVIADVLIRQKEGDGPAYYKRIYDARKAYELKRAPEMKPGHADNSARRYMAKRFLKDLLGEWQRCLGCIVKRPEHERGAA